MKPTLLPAALLILASGCAKQCASPSAHLETEGRGVAPRGSAAPEANRGHRLARGMLVTCLIRSGGRIVCQDPHREFPTNLESFPPAVEIAGGWNHLCARTANAEVWCLQELESEIERRRHGVNRVLSASKVPEATGAVQIAASIEATCARFATGKVVCWGDELRTVQERSRIPPKPLEPPHEVVNLGGAVEIYATGSGQCAVLGNGSVQCASYMSDEYVDIVRNAVPGKITKLGLGFMWPTAALTSDGDVFTEPRLNPLVYIPEEVPANPPKSVPGWTAKKGDQWAKVPLPSPVKDVSGSCALHTDGAVTCWGGNEQVENQIRPAQPKQVLSHATELVSSLGYDCALLEDETVWCGADGNFAQIKLPP